MFAEPLLTSAEDRMEGMRRDMENCRPRDYHHYPQHHDTPDHLRDKSYHYSDSDDREVGENCYLRNYYLIRTVIANVAKFDNKLDPRSSSKDWKLS